ncbi:MULTISPECIES: HAD-IIA family hydrolase [unclassified Crossiella]|uniref:HAD-IIA family hydrolase n=1 Tax=unclassified Crossiella TaxID=2620835 RepID=UPI001FFEFFA7|nr:MULTISPECIES: HAD-IIA family hydrolase [unclassified Crossiella]MCK2243865.1 HAD-IIA family hydrolase [Crossiella sp. S99.2]MCK2257724.1 HAD-IIA family hydrolase [Crossiella sp. S99.1]
MMTTLLDAHDALLLDLDGTVYRGGTAVPGAPEAIAEAKRRGRALRYVTNNASRAPEAVAQHLRELGFPADVREVSTSSQAAAAVLAAKLAAGSPVLVVGAEALRAEVRAVGLRVVEAAADEPVAVVQGHSPETGWAQLAEACIAIRGGAYWLASNVDATLPTERGLLPGNGSMVAALRTATGLAPEVAGKPEPTQLVLAAESAGASAALVVGDRLDTDIAGASAAELPALVVLTGVATPEGLLAAVPEQRCRYMSEDLGGLVAPVEHVEVGVRAGWRVEVVDGGLRLSGADESGEPLSALRSLCAVWWGAGGGAPSGVTPVGAEAEAALRKLGIAW